MKILFLSDDLPPKSFGGAGIVAWNDALSLSKLGNDVFVITTVQNRNDAGEFMNEGVKVIKIFSNYHERFRAYRSLCNISVLKELKNILDKIRPDIVHAHNIHYHISYASLKLSKAYAKKVFITMHDVMSVHYGKLFPSNKGYKINPIRQLIDFKFRYNPLRNFMIKNYLKYVDKIFSVSLELKKALEENGINGVEVLRNGIDSRVWSVEEEKLEEFKKKYNLFGKKLVFYGGRLSGAKGADQLKKIMSRVCEKIPEANLLVVGKGDFGNFDRIILTGWLDRDEIKCAYAVSDVVAVPSLYLDPLPTVVLEAMACAVPVIGTCFGGTPEMVTDGVSGYIVDPNDQDFFADKILDLLMDREKSRKFGIRGQEIVKLNFSQDGHVSRLMEYYKIS